MAEASTQPREPSGLIGAVLIRVARVFGFLIGALLLAIVVEWVGMYFFWDELGAAHSERMIMSEYQALDVAVSDDAFAGHWVSDTAQRFVNQGYWFVAQLTGIESTAVFVSQWTESSGVIAYAQAGLNSIHAFLLRLVVIVLALPAFVLVAMMCGVEGLTLRALRRYGGGHESAYVFHHAKRVIAPSIYLPVIVYLSWPEPLSTVDGICASAAGVLNSADCDGQ